MPALLSAISEAELDALNYERYHYPDPLAQKRLHAVYLKARLNYSYRTISLITSLHPNMAAHWTKVYRKEGLPALKTNNYGTNKSELEVHVAGIFSDFEANPPRSSAEAALRIFDKTGISRSPQQVRCFSESMVCDL